MCEQRTPSDAPAKLASPKFSARRAAAIERARDEVIASARLIYGEDHGKSYPSLHKAFRRLDKLISENAQ
jgi:hypothetical protein